MLLKKTSMSENEHLLGGILDSLDSAILIVRGENCEVLFMNAAARDLFERENPDILSCRSGCGRMFPDLCGKCPNRFPDAPLSPPAFDIKNADGCIFSLSASSVGWIDGRPAHLFILRNVHKERSMEHKLCSLAYTDRLTGVPNQQKLREEYERITERKSAGVAGAIALLDMDNFKAVNDTYGHSTGDVMLKRLAEHLEADPAFSGHLYRLSGDEFVLFYAEEGDRPEAREQPVQALRGAAAGRSIFLHHAPYRHFLHRQHGGIVFPAARNRLFGAAAQGRYRPLRGQIRRAQPDGVFRGPVRYRQKIRQLFYQYPSHLFGHGTYIRL